MGSVARASLFAWSRLLLLYSSPISRSHLPAAGFPTLKRRQTQQLEVLSRTALQGLRTAETQSRWSIENVEFYVKGWVDTLFHSFGPQPYADVEDWVYYHLDPIGLHTSDHWDLAFPGLVAVLRVEPRVVQLRPDLAATVVEVVERTIASGSDEWQGAASVGSKFGPDDLEGFQLILGPDPGISPPDLVSSLLATSVATEHVFAVWMELKRKIPETEIVELVDATRKAASRMPNSRIPLELIRRPDYV